MRPFEWLLLALAAFRLQRIMTKDSWYPTQWWRERLAKRAKRDKTRAKQTGKTELSELFHCPWCFGFWVTASVFVEHHYLTWIPLWVYAIFAASGLVGLLGMYDEGAK